MDDQVDRTTDQELRRHLSARLDRIPVRSTPTFTRAGGGWVGRAAAVPSVMLLMLAAIVGGVALGDWREQQPAGSPAPSAVPPTEAASSTPAGSPFGLDARYGIVIRSGRPGTDGWELVVRPENDARPIATLGSFSEMPTRGAVSPDGRRIALWTNRVHMERNRLVLWDAATPDRTVTLLTSPEGEVGTGLVWAPDSQGLLLSFDSLTFVGDINPISAPPEETVLRTLDVGSRQLNEVARTERTRFVPVAWDRGGGTIAAFEHGPEAPFAEVYLIIRGGQVSRTALGDRVRTERGERIENVIVGIVSSPDASRVVGTVAVAPHGVMSHIVSWPLAEPERVSELRAPEGRAFVPYGWLPGSTRVIVRDGPAGFQGRGVDAPLFLWDVATGDRIPIPGGSTWGGAIPRADGTALYVTGEDEATSVLDIASGAREPLRDIPTYAGAAGEPRYQGVAAGVLLR